MKKCLLASFLLLLFASPSFADSVSFLGVVTPITDSGRTTVSYSANSAAAGSTGTETAITLTKSTVSSSSTGTSFTVTSGRKFRITHLSVATRGHNTGTAQVTTFNFRVNASGLISATSGTVIAATSATPATSLSWDRYIIPIPEGFEITGDGTLQFGITANSVYTTNAPTWYVNILGYEY